MFFLFIVYHYFVASVIVKAVVFSFLDRFVSLHLFATIGVWFVVDDIDVIDSISWWWVREILVFFNMQYF